MIASKKRKLSSSLILLESIWLKIVTFPGNFLDDAAIDWIDAMILSSPAAYCDAVVLHAKLFSVKIASS